MAEVKIKCRNCGVIMWIEREREIGGIGSFYHPHECKEEYYGKNTVGLADIIAFKKEVKDVKA